MRLERRTDVPLLLIVAAPVAAVIAALVLAGGLIVLAGANPLAAYLQMVESAFGSRLAITETLTRTSPLILTGLAAAFAFRARLWNIGGEGQFYLGAIVTAAIGHAWLSALPAPLAVPVLILLGALAGSVALLGPLLLRLNFGVDEVVTTLILNFVILLLVSMLIEGPLKDPTAFGWPQSVRVDRAFMLMKLVPRSRLTIALLISLAAALLLWFVERRTLFGFRARAAGLNPAAARFAGVSLDSTLIRVALISGGLAGMAGALEVIGLKGYVTTDMSPSYGYSGIVVAMLAGLNPLGVVLAALYVGIVFVGADGMSRALGVPSFIANVIVAISLITMLTALLFTSYRIRR